jgi:phosphoglycolate phosphatase
MSEVNSVVLPDVILFDWDGTLADSYGFLEGAHNMVLESLGLPARQDGWFQEYFGMSSDLIYRMVYDAQAEAARTLFLDYFYAHSASLMQPVAGSEDVLKWLREKGIKIGVVTNMRPEGINRKISDFGWGHYFDCVVGADEAARNKPAPDPIFLALERLEYKGETERVWFVGDTITDMDAAKAAGCPRLYVFHGKVESLISNQYNLIYQINDYVDFLVWLKRL